LGVSFFDRSPCPAAPTHNYLVLNYDSAYHPIVISNCSSALLPSRLLVVCYIRTLSTENPPPSQPSFPLRKRTPPPPPPSLPFVRHAIGCFCLFFRFFAIQCLLLVGPPLSTPSFFTNVVAASHHDGGIHSGPFVRVPFPPPLGCNLRAIGFSSFSVFSRTLLETLRTALFSAALYSGCCQDSNSGRALFLHLFRHLLKGLHRFL